jgi:hypothetical protein
MRAHAMIDQRKDRYRMANSQIGSLRRMGAKEAQIIHTKEVRNG